MNTSDKCPQCGAEAKGEEWPSGICPSCFLKLGLSGAIPKSSLPEPDSQEPEQKLARLPKRKWPWLAAAAAFVVVIAIIAWSALHMRRKVPAPVVRFTISLEFGSQPRDLAVSPDGRALVYTASGENGETRMWLRMLDQPTAQTLPETEGAAMPFWSPDSRHIGFFADGKLKETGVEGRSLITLADAPGARGGTWGHEDGGILFAADGGLFRVSDSGGVPQPVVKVSAENKLRSLAWPQYLPNGRSFLFYAEDKATSTAGIYTGNLASGETRKLVDQSGPGLFADGRLLFSRNGVLLYQPFNPSRMELTGEPVPLLFSNPIFGGDAHSGPGFSSGNGILAARTGNETASRLMWIDRQGKVPYASGEPLEQGDFALSPDGTSVAVVRRSDNNRATDLWLLDLRRNAASRLTFDNLDAHTPVWSPDGNRIAFYTPTGREAGIRQVSANGSGKVELLMNASQPVILEGWSPDGRMLIFTTLGSGGKQSVWALPTEGDRKPQPIVQGEFNYAQAALSPDGRWVAYVSDESGRDEVYVRAFPPTEQRWIVSAEGGRQPSWRRDGREIYFVSPHRILTSVAVGFGTRMELGRAVTLFKLPGSGGAYQETADGRFLVSVPVEGTPSPINVVMNWTTEQ